MKIFACAGINLVPIAVPLVRKYYLSVKVDESCQRMKSIKIELSVAMSDCMLCLLR